MQSLLATLAEPCNLLITLAEPAQKFLKSCSFLITYSQESGGSGSGTHIIWHQTRILSLLTFSFDFTHGL